MVRKYSRVAHHGGFIDCQLGPIVRINHQEVHIDDPDFYDKLYNFNPQLDKMKYAIGMPCSLSRTLVSTLAFDQSLLMSNNQITSKTLRHLLSTNSVVMLSTLTFLVDQS